DGAAAESVTVPVALCRPPMTFAGETATDVTLIGAERTVIVVDRSLPSEAVIVTGVSEATTLVVMANVVDVVPVGTVTDAGTLATDELELTSVTTLPAPVAGLSSVTVAVALVPPIGDAGF